MSKTINKKNIILYVVIFVFVAFLIVYFAQRQSHNNTQMTSTSRTDNLAFEMEHTTPISTDSMMMDGGDATMPMMNVKKKTTTQPSVTIKNTETGATTTVTKIKENTVTNSPDKKVIKTGAIDMRVNSVEIAIGQIKTIALQNGGDEVSSDFSKSDSYKEGYIIVKVPVNQYDKTFEQIKKIAPLVIHESSQAQDVTAQFIDLESRIKNKKQHEQQLRSFFDKAETVDELIQIERELARVRTEIEQMEGQLKYLKDQTQYSTISVTLLEDANIVVSDSWRPIQVIKDSFNTLIQKSTALINSVIRFTITSLPFIIIFIIIAWFLYFTAKHIFRKKDK